MNTSIRSIPVFFALLLSLAAPLSTQAASVDDAAQLVQAAASYERGIEQRATGKESLARQSFSESADAFALLVAAHPDNSELRRNLALAQLQEGRLGDGIAQLRFAQARAAASSDLSRRIEADLNAARARVETHIAGDPAPAPFKVLHRLATPAVLWAGLAAMGVGWALLGLRLMAPARSPSVLLALSALFLGSLTLGSVIASLWSIERSIADAAVITADETVARTGPSAAGFPPAFDQPLSAGVEVRITEQRADWVAATLPDGKQAWLPADAIVRVLPNL